MTDWSAIRKLIWRGFPTCPPFSLCPPMRTRRGVPLVLVEIALVRSGLQLPDKPCSGRVSAELCLLFRVEEA
jgi:hypothetical protein